MALILSLEIPPVSSSISCPRASWSSSVFLESSLDDVSKLDAYLAKLLADTQSAIDQRIKEFATKLAPAIKDPDLPKTLIERPKPAALSGFAYYGIHAGSGWSERNFRVTGKPEDAYPEVGDVVIAEVPVNARSGVIDHEAAGTRRREQFQTARQGQRAGRTLETIGRAGCRTG